MKKLSVISLIFSLLFILSCEDKKDTTPPEVTITSPTNGSKVNEVITVSCMSTDNKEVSKVELWVDGVNTGLTDETEPYSFQWNTTKYQDGDHTLIVRGYDTSDNEGDSPPITVKVDNTVSVPNSISITNVNFSNGGFTIDWSKSTDGDFKSYTLEHSIEPGMEDYEDIFITEDVNVTNTRMENTSPLTYHYFRVTVTDTFLYQTKGSIYSTSLDPIPDSVDVKSVIYDLEKMTVEWSESNVGDFGSYKLLYSKTESGERETINTYIDKTVISYSTTTYDPTHENWYWVIVSDTLGQSKIGKGKSNSINNPPELSKLFLPLYFDNNLEIVWTKNHEWDFKSYNLYDLESNNLIFSGNNIDDTTFIVVNFPTDTKNRYKLEVQDHWDLISNPYEIIGSSHQKIIYTERIYGNRENLNEIKIMDIDGSEKHFVTDNKYNKRFVNFSPNGLYITYDLYFDPGNTDTYDIYLSKWNGSGVINLTNNQNRVVYNIRPQFGPHNEKVFFLSYSLPSDENFTNIMSVNIDGTNLISLTPSGSFEGVSFIKDDYIYFFSGDEFNQNNGLYRMDLNGGGRELIKNNDNDDLTSWGGFFPSNNSSDFYYTKYDRDKRMTTLYKYFGDGSSQLIREIDRTLRDPYTSDDYSTVYFYNDHDDLEKRGIYSLNLNTNDLRFLTQGVEISSFNNGLILSRNSVSSNWDIFLFNLETESNKNVTNSSFDNHFSKIQPK